MLFDRPTTAEVKDDSDLTNEQIDALYQDADTDTEVGQKIEEAAVVVEGRLLGAAAPQVWPLVDSVIATAYSGYDSAARAAYTVRQTAAVKLATKYLAISYLYHRAGQLNKAYQAKEEDSRGDYEEIMTGHREPGNQPTPDSLLGQLSWVAGQIQPPRTTSTFSVSPRRVDGYSCDVPEYLRCQ